MPRSHLSWSPKKKLEGRRRVFCRLEREKTAFEHCSSRDLRTLARFGETETEEEKVGLSPLLKVWTRLVNNMLCQLWSECPFLKPSCLTIKSDIYHYRSIQILNDYSSYKSTPHHFVQAVAQKNHFWIALEHTFPPEGLSTINGDHARGPRETKIYRGTRGGRGENIQQEKKRLASH